MQTSTRPSRTSGGPVLQAEVTDAIRNAYFEELAEVGYGRLSIDAVARRAGVGKAAIYRRWKSKLEIMVALASDVAVAAVDVPDTGNLHDDIREYLASGQAALTHPLAQKIIPDLLAEAARNPTLTDALLSMVQNPRRAKAAQLVERAIARGELPADTDIGMCLDLLAGPLYWRLIVVQNGPEGDYLDRLAGKVAAAMKA
jgi:AcrR family transcriptional regulator